MAVGALSHFGFAQELVPGTLITITKFFDPAGGDIDDQFPREAVPTLREDRSQVRSVTKIVETKGNWKAPMYFNALPWFFKLGLGSVTSVQQGATTAYLHTFSGESVLKSFSSEMGYYSGMAKQSCGNKVDKLTISAKAGEAAEVSCDFLGLQTYKNAPATVTGLPADDNIAVFSMAVVKFATVANNEVISMDLGIENGLEAINCLNGTVYPARIAEGVRKITCGMEMDFLDQDMYDLSRAGTKTAVDLTFTGALIETTYYYKAAFLLPNCKFSSVSSPVEADGIISQKVEAIPLYDSVEGYDIQIEVTNTDLAYADPT